MSGHLLITAMREFLFYFVVVIFGKCFFSLAIMVAESKRSYLSLFRPSIIRRYQDGLLLGGWIIISPAGAYGQVLLLIMLFVTH